MILRALLSGLIAALFASGAHATNNPLETVEVTASREKIRKEIQTFVQKVTRLEGEFVGRWGGSVCPKAVGVPEAQAQFIQRRIVEVLDTVRQKETKPGAKCDPNLFVIITNEADQVIAGWKKSDPGMFRWKSREGVSRSGGTGPVRTWHNSIITSSDGRAVYEDANNKPSCVFTGSRITASCWEHVDNVVVLVDAQQTGKVNLAQLADFISVVSLSQIDLSADLGGIDSILRLFAQPPPEVPAKGLTEWDYAFLNGLYRASYSAANQQRDIAARMVRELAPR